jgi:antitoxin YokJ
VDIREAIEAIAASPDCRLYEPVGVPAVPDGFALPCDLVEFYQRCGGAELYPARDYAASVVPPTELRPTNLVMLGERIPDDLSASWFTIAKTGGSDYVSIDFSLRRLGRCYDSFHETHAIAGSCPVIALSFTDLLERLLANRGSYWYWLNPDFISIGDAYD